MKYIDYFLNISIAVFMTLTLLPVATAMVIINKIGQFLVDVTDQIAHDISDIIERIPKL